MILPIVLGLLILASFVVAYMSAKTWPVYQVVLVVFILLGSVAFFYLGARTLATHKSWGELVRRLDQETQSAQQQTLDLVGGDQNAQGQSVAGEIPALKQQLETLVSARGGALYEVAVDSVKDGTATLTLKSPDHGLVPNSVLFVFDEVPIDKGGRYLGEFKVVKVTDGAPAVEMAPSLPLTEGQLRRFAEAKGPWTLYTIMPIDNAETFAALDAAARQSLVPKESLAEYASRERKLRDYEQFFHEHYGQVALLNDAISTLNGNIRRLEGDVQETNREIAYREAEKIALHSDLDKFRYELRVIAEYQKAIEDKLVAVRQSLKATFLENRKLVAALAAAQFRAAEEIDRRTATPAGSTP